jgi:hypothetical protein
VHPTRRRRRRLPPPAAKINPTTKNISGTDPRGYSFGKDRLLLHFCQGKPH